MMLDDASGCNMVLVDFSEYIHSAEGLQDANVITIIDHHGDGSVTTGNQIIYDERPLGSTATIIWIRYRNYGIEPDQNAKHAHHRGHGILVLCCLTLKNRHCSVLSISKSVSSKISAIV